MPIELRFDREKKILHLITGNEVTVEEFDCALNDITHSEDYSPDVPTLYDMRGLDFARVKTKTIRQYVDLYQSHPERGRTKLAVIVNSLFAFGIARMTEALASTSGVPHQIKIFMDPAEGEEWLTEKAISP